MDKPFPATCRECKWSKPVEKYDWNNKCFHPIVNAQDPWALSGNGSMGHGSNCRDERERKWFAPCGMKGKLWEPRQ